MTQELSRLVDNDSLDPHEIDRAIRSCADEEGTRTVKVYQLIGDVMRGQPAHLPGELGGIFEKEPHHLGRGISRLGSIARVSLAAAASVATIGVVGWIGFQGGTGTPAGPAVVRGPAPVEGSLATVAATQPAAPAKPSAPGAVHSQELNDYLIAHRQTPSADLYRPVAAKGP